MDSEPDRPIARFAPKLIACAAFLLCCAGVLIYFGGTSLGRTIGDFRVDRSAERWMLAPGEIQSFNSVLVGGRSFRAEAYGVTYTFEVSGRTYSGTNLTTIGNKVHNRSRYRQLREGSSKTVLYDPQDPENNALYRAEGFPLAMRFLLWGFTCLLGLGILGVLIHSWIHPERHRALNVTAPPGATG